ncbi:MAG TPA: dual specificity protein phosphatase family protein [Acidimicrobiales bacterium]|nr:dual specificity protein phosphatase family protein [Acidimicrobiales bacterium]
MRLLLGAIAFLVIGNLVILASHLVLQRVTPKAGVDLPITNFTVVDDHVWRGAAPGARGYEALAAKGVSTIVDLRAEEDIHVDEAALAGLGLTRFHLPLRDGQAPAPALVERFLEIVENSDGRVFVHCGAGVGRTGTMAAAYLVARDGLSSAEAVRRNLAVGPPSLEQIAFASRLRQGEINKAPTALVAVSRVLDAPRRIWVGVRKSYE